jgi:uncharacterized protein (TIGR03083 family)
MTTTRIAVPSIAAITHSEAMALAEQEASRLIDVIEHLGDGDWARPTDCDGWDVKALLSHVLGAMEGQASVRDFMRQYRAATRAAHCSGRPMIDEMTAAQVRDHAGLSPTEMVDRIRQTAPKALRGRRRVPAAVRALPIRPGAPFGGVWRLGYLLDVIFNRDAWMHRIDLTRASAIQLVLTPDHDGRIVADVVAEWARAHRRPFDLTLEGPAGGVFAQGDGGDQLCLDAVEFCRMVSGRGPRSALFNQEVPF